MTDYETLLDKIEMGLDNIYFKHKLHTIFPCFFCLNSVIDNKLKIVEHDIVTLNSQLYSLLKDKNISSTYRHEVSQRYEIILQRYLNISKDYKNI